MPIKFQTVSSQSIDVLSWRN